MDDVVLRTGLRMLLESWPEVSLTGESGRSPESLNLVARERPDLAVIDDTPGSGDSCFAFMSDLVKAMGKGGVIWLAGVNDSGARLRAVRAGISGIVYKGNAVDELRRAIVKVHMGELWLDRATIARFVLEITRPSFFPGTDSPGRFASLTERERQIALLISQGLSNEAIGARLSISDTTVRHHITSIFAKIGVASRLELTVLLYRNRFPGIAAGEGFSAVK